MMEYKLLPFIICQIPGLTLTGCAGPHTPLGAIWTLNVPKLVLKPGSVQEPIRYLASSETQLPRLRINPSRQILHGPATLTITIDESNEITGPEAFELRVFYNGIDVSQSFIRQSRLIRFHNKNRLTIAIPSVRLPPEEDHQIEFLYKNKTGGTAYARYYAPFCPSFVRQNVLQTGDFRTPQEMISMIEEVATEGGFNPALLAGLIAQESRFNPKAVSWSRALGLTQIATAAEQEVAQQRPQWPRYSGIDQMDVLSLRNLLLAGTINARNEWRINPRKSAEGAVLFVQLLNERWSSYENEQRIRQLFPDPEVARTELILASYHSGYARVLTALNRYGKRWLQSPDLREARKYVNRVFSYCSYFTEPEEAFHA